MRFALGEKECKRERKERGSVLGRCCGRSRNQVSAAGGKSGWRPWEMVARLRVTVKYRCELIEEKLWEKSGGKRWDAMKKRKSKSQKPTPNKTSRDAPPDTTCVPQGSMGANPSLRHPRLIRCFEDRWEQTRCFVCYPSYRYSKRHVRSVRSS